MTLDHITVKINQAEFQFRANSTLQDAVTFYGATPPFAAAVNTQFVPKSSYGQIYLKAGDEIELISPITGG